MLTAQQTQQQQSNNQPSPNGHPDQLVASSSIKELRARLETLEQTLNSNNNQASSTEVNNHNSDFIVQQSLLPDLSKSTTVSSFLDCGQDLG